MKELLQQYAAYNLWANTRLTELILTLSEEQQQRVVTSSFDGIYKTVLHTWGAENMWWQRMKLVENVVNPTEGYQGTAAELVKAWLQQSAQWSEWVHNATEAALQHEFTYYNLKGERFKSPVFQVVQHLFNHGTYHRGQLVTMLRQLGVEKIPATDFIVWTRGKK
jgi:uncharacterized damage-inducible protein DinB